jgi:anti-anti-sigma regulatory factor
MANVTKEQKGNVTVARLTGNVDDTDDFFKSIGTPAGPLVINCRGINRINSVGVKAWIKFFGSLQQQKLPFSFEDFAPVLVENINMVQNFNCGAPITSVMVPYCCGSCNAPAFRVMKPEEIKAASFQPPAIACPKCGQESEFDDDPDEYFAYLQR